MSVMKQFYSTHAEFKSKIIGMRKSFSIKEKKDVIVPLLRKDENEKKENNKAKS